jgi:hypothetical protein
VSGLSIAIDRHDREEPGCRQLLALHGLLRGLERFAAMGTALPGSGMALIPIRLVRERTGEPR